MKNKKKQIELARLIILFKDRENDSILSKLKGIDSRDSPSLTQIFCAFDELTNVEKADFTSYAAEGDFAQEVIKFAVEREILDPKSSAFNGYRNGLITFCFLISKYLGVKRLLEVTPELWGEVIRGLIDYKQVWRDGVSLRNINAARTFRKTFNAVTDGEHLVLKAYSSGIHMRGRAPRETRLQHLCGGSDNYLQWLNLWNEWQKNIVLKNAKVLAAMMSHFIQFLMSEEIDMGPIDFFLLSKKPCFWSYIKSKSNDPRPIATRLHEFSNWIIKDKLSDYENGEYVSLATPLLQQDVYAYVLNYKKADSKGRADNVKAILPIKYLNLLRTILSENDFDWPKSLEWNWKRLTNRKTEKLEDVWHPHMACIYLFLLELPVRKIQVVALDSGEGDDYRWIDGIWQPNNVPTSRYWSKNLRDTQGRGVIRKAYSEGKEATSIYINTNKTQDIDKGFGATSGYTINWHHEQIIKLVDLMRDWQETYNPIDRPTAYRELPKNTFSDSPTDAVFDMIPERFYLFRYPLNSAKDGFRAPPADYLLFKFWHILMNELERRLREMGEDVSITTGWNGQLPNKSIFTPHSLRGSGLTALAEAGVPIEILSKVVAGHSAIIMTLGYVKYNNSYISNVLDEARLRIERSEQENYTQYLKNSTWDDAYGYAVFNEEMDDSEWDATKAISLFENRQIGVCPNSGTRCNEGGEVLRKDSGKTINAPVPGGHGNCVRCRFFMTGLPFLIPLWLKANKDLSDAQRIAAEVDDVSEQLEELRRVRYSIVKKQGAQHVPSSLQAEIKQVEARLDVKSAKLDETLSNVHATYNLVERIRVGSCDDESTLPALLNSQPEFHEVSLFKQRDFIVQASRLYPHIKDEKLEMERNHFIDQIMFNMGMAPITLSALTDTEKKYACDAAANFLNARLSDYELSMLESGKVDIHDLGIGGNDAKKLGIAVEGGLKKIDVSNVK